MWQVERIPSGLLLRLMGQVGARELDNARDEVSRRAREFEVRVVITDLSRVTNLELRGPAIRQRALSARAQRQEGEPPYSLFIAPTPLLYGISRQFELQSGDERMRVVDSWTAAREMLRRWGIETPRDVEVARNGERDAEQRPSRSSPRDENGHRA